MPPPVGMRLPAVVLALCLTMKVTNTQYLHAVRLYSASVRSEGRLDVYINNQWIPFEIGHFNMQVADLACKSWGYTYALEYATVRALGQPESTHSLTVSEVICPQNATSFRMCTTFSLAYTTEHSNEVALKCTSAESGMRLETSNGDFGLTSSGRLEVFVNETWGTVCFDYFTTVEASIACRQLGLKYSYFNKARYDGPYQLNPPVSPVWFYKYANCLPGTSDLRECAVGILGTNECTHDDDVILYCYQAVTEYTTTYSYQEYSIGAVRLVSYDGVIGSNKGRLEVYYYSSSGYAWTPFCESYFNINLANIACQQLGYDEAGDYNQVGTLGIDEGSGPTSISSVDCPSNSRSFYFCTFSQTSSCSHYNDVAVTCHSYHSTLTPAKGISVGVIVGIVVGSLLLGSFLCMGIVLTTVILGVVYRKKSLRSTRSTTVPNQPQGVASIGTYRMSHLMNESDSTTNPYHTDLSAPPTHNTAPQHVSNAQQSVPTSIQHINYMPSVQNTAQEIRLQQNEEDSSSSDDEQPLLP